MIWVLIAILASLVMLMLVAPLVRREQVEEQDGLGVFQGQLAEVNRDTELGLISEAEAETARREINRRWLAASRQTDQDGQASPRFRQAGIIVSMLSVLLAVAAYLGTGRPELVGVEAPDRPEIPPEIQEVLSQVDALAQRLVENPANPEGWTRLGQAYMAMRQYGRAVIAFDNALDYDAGNALLFSQLGEAHFFAARGEMTPAAREAFARALDLDPQEPGARFYMAEALFQDGDVAGAIDTLTRLRSDFPEDEALADAIGARFEQIETGPGPD